jgi:hypothetical protein
VRQAGSSFLPIFWVCIVLALSGETRAIEPFAVEVVEKGTGWPVPMVELRTTHNFRFITDNAGVVALDLPESMGRPTWLEVLSDGYEVPKDGFGGRGVRLTPEPGKKLTIEVTRTIIARRLGRITGAGLFAESQKLGRHADWKESGILGSDSVQTAVHGDKIFWAWGDTNLPDYWLGIFDMSCAITPLSPLLKMEPPVKLKFDYFRDSTGRPRGVAKMPGSGPTWLTAFVSLKDKGDRPHLVATYMKIKPPMELYECGLCVWNNEKAEFERHRVLWTAAIPRGQRNPYPDGHPTFWEDENGKSWILFGNPLPTLRCPATFETWEDPATWEVLSPQATLTSAADGAVVKPHSGSISWNGYRNRWVTVFMESFGKPSAFGEVWYAEADSPTGPWGKALKVLTHHNYTFYNPRLHPELTPTKAHFLLFEGTYSQSFANHPAPTPRYDYNQILYRLDLDDARLRKAQCHR